MSSTMPGVMRWLDHDGRRQQHYAVHAADRDMPPIGTIARRQVFVPVLLRSIRHPPPAHRSPDPLEGGAESRQAFGRLGRKAVDRPVGGVAHRRCGGHFALPDRPSETGDGLVDPGHDRVEPPITLGAAITNELWPSILLTV